MKSSPIGKLISMVDVKNKDNTVSNLLGINISKSFMPSIANSTNLDLTKYKVIKKGIFACNIMHVGRDERLPIALYRDDEPALVSPAYKTFEVLDEKVVLPEFLMMFFQRPEFDRLTWFYCDSSIRGGLDWDRFCDIEVPLPSLDAQKKYVAIHHALEVRKEISHRFEKILKPLSPILLRGVVEQMEIEK
ncbi:hypothetical protein [Aliivibrio fischeri]|uniref:hypothetical protein n=1 Tax=Aliivibrio fischeri TaxID=668 RepID=UPI0018C77630|nr:hypothetical protein [Aliivibrio fischeri]